MIALDFRRPVADPRAYVCNAFGAYYQIRPSVWNYHSSIDIVFQEGSVAHAPIQSVAWGTVTYAERVTAAGYAVFGNLIVVRTTLPDGQVVYCRYAHVENMRVKAGDVVHPGQHLADVGNAYGNYAYHLDFAISPTKILAITPWDWPGADNERVHRDYLDPCSFIRERANMTDSYITLDAAMNNLLAATQDMRTAVNAYKQEPPVVIPPTYPDPDPASKVVTVKADETNVRTSPAIPAPSSLNVFAVVGAGLQLHVLDANVTASGLKWYKISGGVYDGKYIAQSVVNP